MTTLFPAREHVIEALGLEEAPLIDVLMAIGIAEGASSDADKALLWVLHGLVTDFASEDAAVWTAAEALAARMAATREARWSGARVYEQLMAETRQAVSDAPLDVYLATMSLLRSHAVALDHVHCRRARNGQDSTS